MMKQMIVVLWAASLSLTASAQTNPATRPAMDKADVAIQPDPVFQRNFERVLRSNPLADQHRALAVLIEESKLTNGRKITDEKGRFAVEQMLWFIADHLQQKGNKETWADVNAFRVIYDLLDIQPIVFLEVLIRYLDHPDPPLKQFVQEMIWGLAFDSEPVRDGDYEMVGQYFRKIDAATHPDRVPGTFWEMMFQSNPPRALNIMMQVTTPLGEMTVEEREERRSIERYVAAIGRSAVITSDPSAHICVDVLAIELLRELAQNSRWYVRMYVVSRMQPKPLAPDYYDADIIRRLAEDQNNLVRDLAKRIQDQSERERSD